MITPRRTLATILVMFAMLVTWTSRVSAIGPTVLMFYGDPLKKPVMVTGADAALFDNLVGSATIGAGDTTGRSFITVALFWGPVSNPANNGVALANLKPEMAMQHGRFYAATATKPALLLVTQFTKSVQSTVPTAESVYTGGGSVSPAALAALKRLGIQTGTDPSR
jgi:hypothetical protein